MLQRLRSALTVDRYIVRGPEFCGVLVWLVVAFVTSGAAPDSAELTLHVVDEHDGKPLPARIRVRDASGQDHVPSGSVTVSVGPDSWFCSAGTSRLQVPTGQINLRVERGLEYKPFMTSLDVSKQPTSPNRVQLKRWIDMKARGYACGENHLHVPLAELGPVLVAEGLDFGTSLQWWNARRFEVPAGNESVRVLEFADQQVPVSVWDYEIEHNWGAVYVIGQDKPLELEDEPSQPNLPTVSASHRDGALVCYQAGWSREVLLDALLGYVDVVNVCNNNFLRHAYQPRSEYSNLLGIEDFPIYADDPMGMMNMNFDTYYRLLNCGLRLAAGAGSATGPKKTPVGYNRAYVRTAANPTLRQYLEAWRAGRNFVTNGPMLFLRIANEYRPGDTIALGAGGETLQAEVEAFYYQPIKTLEVVVNGRVVASKSPTSNKVARLTVSIPIEAGSWIAARCTADDHLLNDAQLAAYDWGSGRRPRRPCRLRFAHTSPLYINVDGKPARDNKSITEAHRMLDALTRFATSETRGNNRSEFVTAVESARRRLDD